MIKNVFLWLIYIFKEQANPQRPLAPLLNQSPSSADSSDPPPAVGLSPTPLSSAPDLLVMEVKVRQS